MQKEREKGRIGQREKLGVDPISRKARVDPHREL